MSTEDRIRLYLGADLNADVTDFAEIIRRLDGMADDTREDAMAVIHGFFCKFCASRQEEGRYCVCMKDE